MVRYNRELLDECLSRDGATLVGEYDNIKRETKIRFICKCGNENEKTIYNISKKIACCEECYFKNEKPYSRKYCYNRDLLVKCLERDNASLEEEYSKLYAETFIKFTCSCGEKYCKKTFRRINTHGGAYCKLCSVKNSIEKNKLTNLERYNVTCSLSTEESKKKSKETNILKRGVEYALQSKEVQTKIKDINIKKYGCENVMQYPEIAEKNLKSCLKPKEYILPSGETINYQGYENYALDIVFNKWKLSSHDVITNRTKVPEIWWVDEDNKKRRYFTDIYIPSKNTIIEVKSTWTYRLEKTITYRKLEAAKSLGYNTLLWVFDNKGNMVEV